VEHGLGDPSNAPVETDRGCWVDDQAPVAHPVLTAHPIGEPDRPALLAEAVLTQLPFQIPQSTPELVGCHS
jgi:hypothetical protein